MVDISTIRAPLFLPATRLDRLAKAAASGADALIIDLEDAVAASDKDTARQGLLALAAWGPNLGNATPLPPLILRINAADTVWYEDDLAAISALPLHAVMLPKAETSASLHCLAGGLNGLISVIALIETVQGLEDARSIAATPGISRLAFGSIDFCADLGCAHHRDILLSARLELVMASRLGQKPAPFDGVTVQLDDMALTEADASHARDLGMTGKLCIHPKQIAAVHRAFAPSEKDIAWATRVLGLPDRGAVNVDGEMVDEPVRIRARAILAQSQTEPKTGV